MRHEPVHAQSVPISSCMAEGHQLAPVCNRKDACFPVVLCTASLLDPNRAYCLLRPPQAVSKKLGKQDPTLGDVQATTGITITLTATSLARRGPVYLSSDTHPDLPVMEALRSSCAIPLLFAPVRGPGGDLLVDGCISDCTPVGGLGPGVDPSR